MSTLLLRFAAPLQAWGAGSKYDVRKTEREPTKSGVIGMVAAALGRKRDDPVDDLNALRFGVRVDSEGELMRDFHMVHADSANSKHSYLTTRYHLSDAIFLAGLEGDLQLLEIIEAALKSPVFPPYLGRRSCPPEGRICLGLRNASLLDALKAEPWLLPAWRQARRQDARLRIITDAEDATKALGWQRDMPMSFNHNDRRYGFRAITEHQAIPVSQVSSYIGSPTNHDPMSQLGGDAHVSVPNSN